jgi:hypothetical protein
MSATGPSGRNGGFLETYWCALPRLRSRLGAEAALVLARASEGAIPAVEALGEGRVAAPWVECLEVLDDLLHRTLREEAILGRLRAGVCPSAPCRSSPDLARIPARVRVPGRRHGAAARLVRALRRRRSRAGVELHERSRVTSIRPARSRRRTGACALRRSWSPRTRG